MTGRDDPISLWFTCVWLKALFDSLFSWRCGCVFRCVNIKHNLCIDILEFQAKLVLAWMLGDLTDGKSTLVQVMSKVLGRLPTSIIWANVDQDLRRHMALLTQKKLSAINLILIWIKICPLC